jgi:putative toxin-antitoxin system antitoxin component (TIGR02293 family)
MSTTDPKARKPRGKGTGRNTKKLEYLVQWTASGFAVFEPATFETPPRKISNMRGISLGLKLRDTNAVIGRLKEGLTIEQFEHLCEAMDLSPLRLAAAAGIAPRSFARRKREGVLQPDESERVFRFSALFDTAVEVFGDIDAARRWFKEPLRTLHGQSPLDYADTEPGAREVEDILGRLEHGVFS